MHQERKGWFEKNWWWSLPCGCLGCIVLLIGGCVVLVGVAFTGFRTSAPFEEALDRARAHPAVVGALGEPIEAGWQVDARVDVKAGRTVSKFTQPISGPRGEAQLRVEAERVGGEWRFERLEVELDDGSVVDLLDESGRPTSEI